MAFEHLSSERSWGSTGLSTCPSGTHESPTDERWRHSPDAGAMRVCVISYIYPVACDPNGSSLFTCPIPCPLVRWFGFCLICSLLYLTCYVPVDVWDLLWPRASLFIRIPSSKQGPMVLQDAMSVDTDSVLPKINFHGSDPSLNLPRIVT